jgi:hypothetical protein
MSLRSIPGYRLKPLRGDKTLRKFPSACLETLILEASASCPRHHSACDSGALNHALALPGYTEMAGCRACTTSCLLAWILGDAACPAALPKPDGVDFPRLRTEDSAPAFSKSGTRDIGCQQKTKHTQIFLTKKMTLTVERKQGKIFSPIRQKWLMETPEEGVRQEYLCVLVNEYGFSVGQIGEEAEVTGRGSAQARADFIVWRTAEDKAGKKPPFIVVECKADNVTITERDYHQGENYARLANAPFFVTHNRRETKFWRVRKDRMPGYIEEIENIPHAGASDKEVKELIEKLKIFKEDEFADLLHRCHNIIRNREHLDPAAAFDEIAKILFVKTGLERRLKAGKQLHLRH